MEQGQTPTLTLLSQLNTGAGDFPNPRQAAVPAMLPWSGSKGRASPGQILPCHQVRPYSGEMSTGAVCWGLAHFGLISSHLYNHSARA